MKLQHFLLIGLAIGLLTGCSLASDITPPPNYVSPTPGPTESPLFPQNPPDVAHGKIIFAEKCAPCHGEKGLGDGPMAAQLQKQPAAIGSAELGKKDAMVNWFTIVTQGNINSFMPPFKDSLSDQDRWDVVSYAASLGGFTSDEAAAGKALYEASCVQCHGSNGNLIPTADFSDQALMSKISQNDIANFIVNGVGKMPGFGSTIPQDGIVAISSYVRTFTISLPASTTADTNTNTEPTATADAAVTPTAESAGSADGQTTPQAEATVEGTPQPSDTTSTTPAADATTGTIKGLVSNGTGGSIPSGLKVTLHGFTHNTETQQFNEVLTVDATVADDGTYSFTDVSFTESQAFYASIEFSGSVYNSDPGFVDSGKTELNLPINVFETTTDTSAMKADQVHLLLDYSKQDVVQVIEFLIFSNTGNKSIVAAEKGGPIIDVPLPANYTNLQFESGAIGDRYIKTNTGFADTSAVNPGDQGHQIVFSIDLPLSKANLFGSRSIKIEQDIPFAASKITILSPEGVTVSGSNVQSSGVTDMGNGAKYLSYAITLAEPKKHISVSVNGLPKDSKIASTSSNTGIIIGVGALGVVLIIVGIWMYFFSKKEKPEEEDEESIEEDTDQTDILDAILALDDQYKNGNLEEAIYKNKRKALTEQLKLAKKK